uniref:Family with sequence similarity 78 member B n=1 Tax=Equus caballus TaxID=9796 RepID=A0A9L0RDF0_HORSE
MGCIQSITCKARIRRENIVVYDVCATIDQCPTRIEETSPIVLRYKTPYFKASARVVMPPIPRHETWVVGWIQACNQMEFFNTYSDLGMSVPVPCCLPTMIYCSYSQQLSRAWRQEKKGSCSCGLTFSRQCCPPFPSGWD